MAGPGKVTGQGSTEYISRDHVQGFIERLINYNEQMVHSFYAKTEYDPRLPIKKGNLIGINQLEDFLAVFKRVQNLPMFSWVPALVDGYNKEDCLNIEEGRSVETMRRLTMIQNERARNEAEKLGFTSSEHDNMQEFFNRELKRSDAKRVIATIEKMFKDI